MPRPPCALGKSCLHPLGGPQGRPGRFEENRFTIVWNQTGVPRCYSPWRGIPTEPTPASKAHGTDKRRKLKQTATKRRVVGCFLYSVQNRSRYPGFIVFVSPSRQVPASANDSFLSNPCHFFVHHNHILTLLRVSLNKQATN